MLCCCEYPENPAFLAIRHASWVLCTEFCRLLVCKSGSSRLEASQKNKWGKGQPGWLLVKRFCWKRALRQLCLFYDVFVSGLGPLSTSASFEIFFALNIAFLIYREAELQEHPSKKKHFCPQHPEFWPCTQFASDSSHCWQQWVCQFPVSVSIRGIIKASPTSAKGNYFENYVVINEKMEGIFSFKN